MGKKSVIRWFLGVFQIAWCRNSRWVVRRREIHRWRRRSPVIVECFPFQLSTCSWPKENNWSRTNELRRSTTEQISFSLSSSPSSELYSIEDAERLATLSSDPSATSAPPSSPSTSQHRRNRSDPITSASLEDLPLNSDEQDSVVIRRSLREESSETPQRRSLIQFSSKMTSTKKKKKIWYNVRNQHCTERERVDLHSFLSSFNRTTPTGKKNCTNCSKNFLAMSDCSPVKRLENPSLQWLFFVLDYSCAWQKEILVQGRMYLTVSSVCFHANLFSWKTSVSLKFSEIVGISREKTAMVISNAIEIKSSKGEKYFFASFLTREKTFALLTRLWQATINEEVNLISLSLLTNERTNERAFRSFHRNNTRWSSRRIMPMIVMSRRMKTKEKNNWHRWSALTIQSRWDFTDLSRPPMSNLFAADCVRFQFDFLSRRCHAFAFVSLSLSLWNAFSPWSWWFFSCTSLSLPISMSLSKALLDTVHRSHVVRLHRKSLRLYLRQRALQRWLSRSPTNERFVLLLCLEKIRFF